MDGEKFDELIRKLTTIRLTRLSALRGMVAGAAAAVTGASVLEDAEAKKAKKKAKADAKGGNHKGGKGGSHKGEKKGGSKRKGGKKAQRADRGSGNNNA